MKMQTILVLAALCLLASGCALRSPVSETRDGSTITFTQKDSGRMVAVSVGAPYVYEKDIDTEFRGVRIKGPLFNAPDDSAIVVSRLSRDDFEKIVAVQLDSAKTGVTAYPAKTILQKRDCKLVRAHVVTLDDDVVAAVSVRGIEVAKGACQWGSIKELQMEMPDVVADFNTITDRALIVKTSDPS